MAVSKWSEKGFSLLELMVALGIFATAVVTLITVQTASARNMASARHKFVAATLARELLAQVEIDGLPSFDESDGDFGEDFPEYTWEVKVEQATIDPALIAAASDLNPGLNIDDNILFVPDALKQVNLTVVWLEQGHRRKATVTYFAVAQ